MKHIKLFSNFINEADRKWNDKRRGPHPYDRGLTKKEQEEKERQMKDQSKLDNDDPDAYKEMPGDKEARKKGEVKTSKHVKSYHELYGDKTDEALADHEEDDADYDKLYKKYKYSKKNKKTVSESKMPKKYIGNDEIVFLKTKDDSKGARYNLYYKGHDIEIGGVRFGSEKELKSFADNYILSNQWYNKLKYEDSKPLPESVVTEAKNTIGLAFKEEQEYLDFKEFIKDEKGSIKKDFGWDSKTKSWEVIMDVKVLDSIYGEGTPGNKESGWYGALPGDFESVIIESVVTEARFNYKETGLSGQNLKDVKDGITGIKNALKRGNESAVISNYDLVQQRLQQYGGPKANDFLEKIKQLAGLDESAVTEAKDMTFTDYLKVLDAKFEDAMKAVRGDNGSDAAITPTRGDILQNFTLFRNYVSALTKKYKGDKTKLRFITERANKLNELMITEKVEGDRGPIDDEKVETALKKKQEETGVPLEFLRLVMRRGMAAWKTGHRPGASVHQWGYARVNSFLTKQSGTWGGADKDIAKEVRDGGHDKKLKKA